VIHSRFSPASMPAELLERTFVQREELAKRLTNVFAESALTESKHHVLLVGPRGAGKSHLVSVVYHRLKRSKALTDRMTIAFLREDEWGITSFADLLIRILRAIEADYAPSPGVSAEEVENEARKTLESATKGKTLLVIAENVDAILSSLGEAGQRKWRALIQTECCWAVLAAAPALSPDISSQAAPFYGFFEIQHLEGLTVEEAVELLRRLALSQGNRTVAEYLNSAAGRARVRAVQHLANGNHRIFVIFYDFLTDETNGELVEPLIKTIDALTPYYQSQMKELSRQQRKIVEFLCEHRSPANVKAIASGCIVSHQTAASQLKQLLAARYLRVTRIGREAYYELNEPLLRICVEAKSHSGEPIRLLVEFLRYWFARQELTEKLASVAKACPQRDYLQAALREYDNVQGHEHLSPEVSRLCVALSLAELSKDKAVVISTATELAEVSKIAEDWIHYTRALSFLGAGEEAVAPVLQAAKKNPRRVEVLIALARAYDMAGESDKALAAIEDAVTLEPANDLAWFDKGQVLDELGRHEEAFGAFSQAARLDPDWPEPQLMMGTELLSLRNHVEAERVLKPLLKYGDRMPALYSNYGLSLARAGEFAQALQWLNRATETFPDQVEGWRNKAWALDELKRPREALGALKRAMELDPRDDRAQHLYCRILFALGEHNRSLRELPTTVVAHQIFHELLELSHRELGPKQLRSEMAKLQSIFTEDPGPEGLAGGLTEYASEAHRQMARAELPELQVWNKVVAELFKEQPRFAIVSKMFDVMVRYKESGDEKVLMELPLEQRQLLKPPSNGPTN